MNKNKYLLIRVLVVGMCLAPGWMFGGPPSKGLPGGGNPPTPKRGAPIDDGLPSAKGGVGGGASGGKSVPIPSGGKLPKSEDLIPGGSVIDRIKAGVVDVSPVQPSAPASTPKVPTRTAVPTVNGVSINDPGALLIAVRAAAGDDRIKTSPVVKRIIVDLMGDSQRSSDEIWDRWVRAHNIWPTLTENGKNQIDFSKITGKRLDPSGLLPGLYTFDQLRPYISPLILALIDRYEIDTRTLFLIRPDVDGNMGGVHIPSTGLIAIYGPAFKGGTVLDVPYTYFDQVILHELLHLNASRQFSTPSSAPIPEIKNAMTNAQNNYFVNANIRNFLDLVIDQDLGRVHFRKNFLAYYEEMKIFYCEYLIWKATGRNSFDPRYQEIFRRIEAAEANGSLYRAIVNSIGISRGYLDAYFVKTNLLDSDDAMDLMEAIADEIIPPPFARDIPGAPSAPE